MKRLARVITLMKPYDLEIEEFLYSESTLRISEKKYFENKDVEDLIIELECLRDVSDAYIESHWLVIEFN